jgi:sodium transport system ATP-binding protein
LRGLALDRRVADLIDDFGLDAIADRRAAGLSQGERMKTALARALVHAPSHLLLDEPTNGLDIPSVHTLRHVLKRMRERGTCIVFSTHVLEEVRALCDTVVVVSRGRVVASADIAGICRSAACATLEDAYLKLTGRLEMVS